MTEYNKEFWKDKKVFISGGTGFIGTHLTNTLLSLGANIKLLIHESKPQDENLIGFYGDVSSLSDSFTKDLKGFSPDVIFHLAAQPIVGRAAKSPVQTLDVNSRGSYLFLDACSKVSSIKSIIYISTDKVYGDIELINDNSELRGVSHPYNASKVMGDVASQLYMKFYNLPIVIIRHGNVYGPGDFHWERIVPRTLLKIFYNESPVVRGNKKESTRDYIFIDDVVDGYLAAAELGNSTVLNLGSEKAYPAFEIVNKLLKFCDKNIPIKNEVLWKGELVHQHFEETETSKLIAWKPKVSIDYGLRITANWYMKYFEDMMNE